MGLHVLIPANQYLADGDDYEPEGWIPANIHPASPLHPRTLAQA